MHGLPIYKVMLIVERTIPGVTMWIINQRLVIVMQFWVSSHASIPAAVLPKLGTCILHAQNEY